MIFPPGFLQGPKIETKKALILLDFQNDFLDPNGRLPVTNTASFVPKLPALITKFREKGQIVFVRTLFQQPCPVFSPSTGGYNVMLKSVAEYSKRHPRRADSSHTDLANDDEETVPETEPSVDGDIEAYLSETLPPNIQRCCLPGTKGSELIPQLVSCFDKQKDMMLTKSQYSLFTSPMVVMQLRARLISDLYICGSLSNVGVYATVLDAVQQGFNVTLIEDCLGYRDDTCHLEAMTQMADSFGANGIDYSELMDDLHGLLGDVVPASKYTRTFQLSMHAQNGNQVSSTQRVSQWMDTIESEPDEPEASTEPASKVEPILAPEAASAKITAPPSNDSFVRPFNQPGSPVPSPPRKRSTSDRDDDSNGDDNQASGNRFLQDKVIPRSHPENLTTNKPTLKKTRRESTASRASKGSNHSDPNHQPPILYAVGHSHSTGQLETLRKSPQEAQYSGRAMSHPGPSPTTQPPRQKSKVKTSKTKLDQTYLGPDDTIGESDSRIIYDVLPIQDADEAFSKLKHNTAWQKMYHRTGEVPRLVAVQGNISNDGTIPIYRHPADESPPLQPFDSTVDWLRKRCEELVNHPLNHVLIQYYRTSEDNISEHSDKTLDIVRGSTIVNLSLGAMRTMTLRTKRAPQPIDADIEVETGTSPKTTKVTPDPQPRVTQRIRLSHNSLFVLGEHTNANWLHSIKADKRPTCEKSAEELDFGGERISLTFRHIGTFIDPEKLTIFGQGATRKTREEARTILKGKEAEEVGEKMIIGFGRENHLNDNEFKWEEVYGSGFDVVNFVITTNAT